MKIINNFREFSFIGKMSLIFIIMITIVAIFAPFFSKYPVDKSSGIALQAPGAGHIFGTDDLGYDIWSQIAYGARISLLVGFGTAFFSAFLGSIIGIISAYFGGFVDKIIMRVVDILIIMPGLPLMIVMAAFFGPSILNVVLVISLFSWVMPARIIRSRVLILKEMTYIKSAESYGAGIIYLIKKHFLPAIFPLLAVNIIKISGRAIVTEASLSFLGLGDPTSNSWGLIINHAISFSGIYYTPFWKWWLLFPWMFLSLLIVSLAFLSRELEDKYTIRK